MREPAREVLVVEIQDLDRGKDHLIQLGPCLGPFLIVRCGPQEVHPVGLMHGGLERRVKGRRRRLGQSVQGSVLAVLGKLGLYELRSLELHKDLTPEPLPP